VSDALLTAIGGIVGGGAVGAWLTGFLTIQQKKIARRQKRRALAYAEAITWMKLVMTAHLAYLAEADGQPVSTEKFVSPVTNATFPFPVPAAGTEIGLGSNDESGAAMAPGRSGWLEWVPDQGGRELCVMGAAPRLMPRRSSWLPG
jgi:hypothetical protein